MDHRQQISRNPPAGSLYPELRLKVTEESLPFFTTALQYGVEIETQADIPLGKFLDNIPGFSKRYLSETVQTIFLDGTAIDDLQMPLSGPHPVIALSAAMPGLAGAIFRKNGPHASLRTRPPVSAPNHCAQGPITVTLKLFNRIAREKGELLLFSGAVMASSSLSDFLTKRTELLDKIKNATLDSKPVPIEELAGEVRGHELLTLFVSAEISPY